MPMRPSQACIKCGRPVSGASYHPECDPRPQQRREHDRFRNQLPYRQLYNTPAWKRLHDFIMARDPVCMLCHRAGSEVADHIRDHRGNLKLFFDACNLRGLCKACHDKKTGTEHGFGTDSTPDAGGIAPQLAGSIAGTSAAHAGSNPAPPTRLPVATEHLELPDGFEACKKEYARWYRKLGDHWLLLPEDFKLKIQESA